MESYKNGKAIFLRFTIEESKLLRTKSSLVRLLFFNWTRAVFVSETVYRLPSCVNRSEIYWKGHKGEQQKVRESVCGGRIFLCNHFFFMLSRSKQNNKRKSLTNGNTPLAGEPFFYCGSLQSCRRQWIKVHVNSCGYKGEHNDANKLVLFHSVQCFIHEPTDCRCHRPGSPVWARRPRCSEEKR